jgi:hypothetical protein
VPTSGNLIINPTWLLIYWMHSWSLHLSWEYTRRHIRHSIVTNLVSNLCSNHLRRLFYSGPRFGPPYSSPKAAIQSMLRTRGNSGYGMSGSNQHSLQTLQMMQQHQKSQMVRAQIRHQVGHNRMSDMPLLAKFFLLTDWIQVNRTNNIPTKY